MFSDEFDVIKVEDLPKPEIKCLLKNLKSDKYI